MLDLHSIFHSLMLMLEDLTAGPIPLKDIINATRPSKPSEFVTFLKVLEVFGSGYEYFAEA